MNPEVLLVTTPAVNFRAFLGACLQVLGYSPARAADASPRELSEPEKFLSCLAALRDQKAPAGLAPNLLSHVSFSVFVVADERDMLDILERCAGMPFVTAETTARGVTAAVVTGTWPSGATPWRPGPVRDAEPSVRAGFNKVYRPLLRRGPERVGRLPRPRGTRPHPALGIQATTMNALLPERQHHALLRRQPSKCCRRCPSRRGFCRAPIPPTDSASWGTSGITVFPASRIGRPFMRVCKPGALMLAFGGTRTYHRLTCAIEDAGWEIRDCLMWLYGQGFPKAPDIGLLIDKAKGAKREVVGTKLGQPGYSLADNGRTNEVYGDLHNPAAECAITAPATELAKPWTGWANSLKPAWEPITLAMKPLDGTLAHNAETWGVAGLNIDASRIGTDGTDPHPQPAASESDGGWDQRQPSRPSGGSAVRALAGEPALGRRGGGPARRADRHAQERHDEGRATAQSQQGRRRLSRRLSRQGLGSGTYGDSGGASRFFYVAKASQEGTQSGPGAEERPPHGQALEADGIPPDALVHAHRRAGPGPVRRQRLDTAGRQEARPPLHRRSSWTSTTAKSPPPAWNHSNCCPTFC